MLTRKRYREVPPRVDYELTPRARDLTPVLAELAVWGYRWAWSQPRAGERVDLGAIFRLVPGLVDAGGHRAEIQCTVTDGHRDGGPLTLSVKLEDGNSEVSEQPSDSPTADIRGDTRAWVTAFAPSGVMTGLEISGDASLAEYLLTQLVRAEAQAVAAERAVA
jgi:hypothetical protein